MTTIQIIGALICIGMVTMFAMFILGTVSMAREVSEDELAGALEGDLTEAVKDLNGERT